MLTALANSSTAIIRERHYPVDMGRWVVERVWDRNHPGCPFAYSLYDNQLAGNLNYVEQIVLSGAEYREAYGGGASGTAPPR